MEEDSSRHYTGSQGEKYFSWQKQGGIQRGKINSRKFSRFIHHEDTVLDFGCGGGYLLSCINCKRKIGIEINPAARNEAINLGLEVYETLNDVQDGTINVVISNHALEHVLHPLAILQILYQKLSAGGKIVLCLPFDDWRTQKQYNPKDINHHLYTWTPLLIGHLLSEAGFIVQRTWIYSFAWPFNHWQYLNAHLPEWLFDQICKYTAWRYNQRQVMALALKD